MVHLLCGRVPIDRVAQHGACLLILTAVDLDVLVLSHWFVHLLHVVIAAIVNCLRYDRLEVVVVRRFVLCVRLLLLAVARPGQLHLRRRGHRW